MMTLRRPSPRALVSVAWIAPAVLGAVNEIAQRRLRGLPPAGLPSLLFAGGDWLLYAFLTPAVFAASERWPLSRPRLVRHVTVHLFLSLVFCALWAAAGAALRSALMPESLDGSLGRHFVAWLFITLPFGVAVYLAVVGIEHGIRYFAEARDRELQLARVSEQLSNARFAALQARLNPHFLFNTLNTLTVLVRDGDQPGALRIVEHLGEVLRRTLGQDRAHEVTLEVELELVRQYLAIEEARFSDRLRVQYRIDDSASGALLPTFGLQHLVENALRHGIARRLEAGRVTVSARRDGADLVVAVADDGIGVTPAEADRPGHGLENTRERLRALYGGRASLRLENGEAGGCVATMRVPFHEAEAEDADDGR